MEPTLPQRNHQRSDQRNELSHTLLWALPASALWGLGAWFRCGATPSELAWLVGCAAWSLPVLALAWTTLRFDQGNTPAHEAASAANRPFSASQRWALTLGLGIAWSVIPASILAASIKQHTHLRPLGAVTLTVLTTILLVGAALLARQVLRFGDRRGASRRSVHGLVIASLLVDLLYLSAELAAVGVAGLMLDLGALAVLLFAGQRLADRYFSSATGVFPSASRGAWLIWLALLATPWLLGPGTSQSAPLVEGLPGLLVR